MRGVLPAISSRRRKLLDIRIHTDVLVDRSPLPAQEAGELPDPGKVARIIEARSRLWGLPGLNLPKAAHHSPCTFEAPRNATSSDTVFDGT